MARIGVCDDNAEFTKMIADIVKKSFLELGNDFEVESFTDGMALIEKNRFDPFDVLFLDIDMPNVGGFDIAKMLRDDFSKCIIVFVTSHAELVFDSLDFQPFNFVRKNSGVPLSESIPRIVNKLAFHLKQDETILIEDEHLRKTPVRIRDIICIESCGHYLKFSISERSDVKVMLSRGSLAERQEFFESYSFARVHKGFLVNLSQIKYLSIGKREIELSGGITVPIGKIYKTEVEEKYSLYLRRKL